MKKVVEELQVLGVAASSGIAIGPAYCYRTPALTIPDRERQTVGQEIARFNSAVDQAKGELQDLSDLVSKRIGEKEAAIFEAHQMMLVDPTLAKGVRAAVEKGQIIEQAVLTAVEEVAILLAAMSNELFAARAADVRDVGRRVLRILLGVPDMSLGNVRIPSIIIAGDLSPSDTANLDPHLTLGFCTALGGLTSHSAILARTMGIPAIVALGDQLLEVVSTGTELILDGKEGELVISPCDETVEKYERKKREHEKRMFMIKTLANEPARTANGRLVEVAANIGNLESCQDALNNGAEGVGLLRTEFLYLEDAQSPGEEKQYRIYRRIFDVMQQRPVIIRTLDIGGDKPPSYLPFPQEMNPFLGWRAIRISLDRPELFQTQLRAILRAALGHQVRIMFPMVNGLDELRRARQVVETVKTELRDEGKPFATDVPVGIMVETPAAALLVDVLSEAADFFSIGTNDLTQYTLAVDRGNATVAGLYQPLHPAVLRLIKKTIDLAHEKGKWVGMCGELAGMLKAIPILLGLGLDEFSMNPRAIPEAKYLIHKLDDNQSRRIASHVFELSTAADIEAYMQEVAKKI
jgi:phosphoenolpyruvate-protein phosphotransferase (PTS system enzyme I)